MDKILKTIDALKMPSLSSPDANIPGTISSAVVAASDAVKTKKKERITHCRAVADAVCNPSVQGLTDYNKILESVIEVLFQLCNDPDPDIRLAASDCLNRIARTLKDSLQPRFHMEVYREIRKNQSPRSLRAALNLFAFIAPTIRPQKCRAFLTSLLPCFAQIAKRTEETVFETLAPSFTEIFKYLGSFAHDSEIKILCKDFMANLESNSAKIRRSSALVLVAVSKYSKNPSVTLPNLLTKVIEILMPNMMEKSVSSIIGVLLFIRHAIPILYEDIHSHSLRIPPIEQDSVIASLLQVYEICMIFCNHDDHNVITTSLETLQQLFTAPIEPLVLKLLSPSGVQNSLDSKSWNPQSFQASSPSISAGDDSLERLEFQDESSTLLESDGDVPKFRSVISSVESCETSCEEDSFQDPSIRSSGRRNSDLFVIEGTLSDVESTTDDVNFSDDEVIRDTTPTRTEMDFHSFPEIQIGSLYETNIPLYYCTRFLAYNFLLAGKKDVIRPDTEVRVSVKVMAMNCIVNIIGMCPETFQLTLSPTLVDAGDDDGNSEQTVEDITLYISHCDPLLRGTVYMLIGTFIKSTLSNSVRVKEVARNLSPLINLIRQGLTDSSNVGVKCAVDGVSNCINILLKHSVAHHEIGKILLSEALKITSNPYWLIKVGLIELFTSIPWGTVDGFEDLRNRSIHVLMEFLKDEDVRIRSSCSTALIQFIRNSATCTLSTWDVCQIFCKECVANQVNVRRALYSIRHGSTCSRCEAPNLANEKEVLEEIVNLLLSRLNTAEEKFEVAGYLNALSSLSDEFQPKLMVEFLRTSTLTYDLSIHQSALSVAGSIFSASEFISSSSDKFTTDEANPFHCSNSQISNCGIQLLQHSLAVMKVYQSVLDSINSNSPLRKQSTSPVISPVKKFSQKLEAEKKTQESDKKSKGLTFSDTVCPTHFKKLHDAILQSFKIYKSSLDQHVATKFSSLLITSLEVTRKLFSFIRLDYSAMTSLIDEVLGVSTAIFYLCPVPILRNIRQMLSCIFSSYDSDSITMGQHNRLDTKNDLNDFLVFAKTYETTLVEVNLKSKVSMKGVSDKSSLSSYIRQFESVVVKALTCYTTSADPAVQGEVLELLIKLIEGHVNYKLVDSSQVFLGYVLKQIGSLDGYVRNPTLLTQEIFHFLTVLTHEYPSSKKFVDLAKTISLCESLVVATENSSASVTTATTALRCIVNDLFVYHGCASHTNQEKREIESHRNAVTEMVMKLIGHPEAFPSVWLLLQGRKINNISKWMEDSDILTALLLKKVQEETVILKNMSQFNNLIALLCALNVSSVPSQDLLVAILSSKLSSEIRSVEEFVAWSQYVNIHWFLLIKRMLHSGEGCLEDATSCSVLLTVATKLILSFRQVFRQVVDKSNRIMAINQTGVFLKLTSYLMKSELSDNFRQELVSQQYTNMFTSLCTSSRDLAVVDSRFVLWMVELLSSLQYPVVTAWMNLLQPSPAFPPQAMTLCVLKLTQEINEGDISSLEEWLIVNYSQVILKNILDPNVALFVKRLSTYRMQQILDQITIILESFVDTCMGKSILIYLERVAGSFLCETAVLTAELMNRTNNPFLLFETSQFCCHVFAQIYTRKVLFTNKDREKLRNHFSKSNTIDRYPRLATLVHKVLCENLEPFSIPQSFPIPGIPLALQWHDGHLTDTEGLALAKMLASLKYTHVTAVFNSKDFKVSMLKHCFRFIHQLYRLEEMTAMEVSDLFTSQKRADLIEKSAFSAASVELILDKLDAWENVIGSCASHGLTEQSVPAVSLQGDIVHMWSALTELLNLKVAVRLAQDHSCNNFIPTRIFVISFEYMSFRCQENTDLPLQELKIFLKFASMAVCDSSFLTFFDVRDNPSQIFSCVLATGVILRTMVKKLGISFNFNHYDTDAYNDMSSECITVLQEFYHLIEFLRHVENGSFRLESEMFNELRMVIAGLGRCELINGWILISHLGWRPQVISKSTVFPPIQQIPLEILRNEPDMLLTYISKLSLLGVASKVQFEENWVIFLSVINLYVDETFHLQIVISGLRALSMMLQQSVKVKYTSVSGIQGMSKARSVVDFTLEEMEPATCSTIDISCLYPQAQREFENRHGIDVNSCIRFLTDLYSQWLQNPQGKMPLYLLSEVIQSIVVVAEYFEDPSQYSWMYETLSEIYKSVDKEDEVLWPHLVYGVFYSAAKQNLEHDSLSSLLVNLESYVTSPSASIANIGVKCALVYLQCHPDCSPLINTVVPHILKKTQLDEMTNSSECYCLSVWTLVLFIWSHSPADMIATFDFEQEVLRNILTVLSPLNKVYVSVRLLVMKGIRFKVEMRDLKPEAKKIIFKVTSETLRTPNVAIFIQTLKLFVALFYDDFLEYVGKTELEPEVLMPMVERVDVLFQHIRSRVRCHGQMVARVLPLLIRDFLPPSEILNRVIAEFLSPVQLCPELVAPSVAMVFEKAKRRPNEAALVREWIIASLSNFVANPNVTRAMWSLTVFFIGVSTSQEINPWLPLAHLTRRRSTSQSKEMFIHSAVDFYVNLDEKKKANFKKILGEVSFHHDEKTPYALLLTVLEKVDAGREPVEVLRDGRDCEGDF